jgi:uncharacterized protein YaaN involved in tellurite resistance
MRTLIERLRTPETSDPVFQSLGDLCREAADEIERETDRAETVIETLNEARNEIAALLNEVRDLKMAAARPRDAR